jgi:hypothetical protein
MRVKSLLYQHTTVVPGQIKCLPQKQFPFGERRVSADNLPGLLIATTCARKMSLDMRLIDPLCDGHPQNKLSLCAEKIAEYCYRFNGQRGTQFFFSDLGTYKKGARDFNLYAELKRKSVEERHIPAREIRFIQECKNSRERKELFAAMNSGSVRILLGSTVMLGTGVNAQRRAVAVHHFDIPWKPSEMERRNGRVARPGNVIAKKYAGNRVDCFVYATENTLDVYKFNILQHKQMFISQMKRGSIGLRTIDEGALDDGGSMNFAEYVAIMSGNNDLLEKARMEKIIISLENERKAFNNNRYGTQLKLEATQQKLKDEQAKLAGLTDDLNDFNRAAPANEKGRRPNGVVLSGYDASTPEETGRRLHEIKTGMDTKGRVVKIGKLYGFDLAVCTYRGYREEKYSLFYVIGKNGRLYSHNNGYLASSPETAARYFISALERLPRLIENTASNIQRLKNDIPVLQKILENTWNHASKLQKLKSELAAIDRKIMKQLKIEN